MRIEPKVVVPVSQESREPKAATPDKSGPSAVVTLSKAADQASQADSQVAAANNAARLAEIRASIRRGAYPIDLDKLAAKIVDDEFVRGAGK